MFDNFMTALMHAHPLGERELNAERLGPYGKDLNVKVLKGLLL